MTFYIGCLCDTKMTLPYIQLKHLLFNLYITIQMYILEIYFMYLGVQLLSQLAVNYIAAACGYPLY
jgi:hypothetical protein